MSGEGWAGNSFAVDEFAAWRRHLASSSVVLSRFSSAGRSTIRIGLDPVSNIAIRREQLAIFGVENLAVLDWPPRLRPALCAPFDFSA
jgi:hypothetical protein